MTANSLLERELEGFQRATARYLNMINIPLERFGICHGMMIHLTPPEFVAAAARAGFRNVTLRINQPPSATSAKTKGNFPMLGDTPMRRETKARLREHGVQVNAGEVIVLTPGMDLRSLQPVLESAAYLGAGGVVAVPFGQQSEEAAAQDFGAFAQICAEHGVRPLMEFVALSAVKSLTAAARIVAAAGVNQAIVCDTLHFIRGGGQVTDFTRIDPDSIYAIQVNDGPLDFPDVDGSWWVELGRRRFPGEGEFPLEEVLQRVPERALLELEVISEDFIDSGLSGTAMAETAMNKLRSFLSSVS